MLRIALIAFLLPAAAQALPDQQLRFIENELRFAYNLDIDATQLTNAQASAIYLEVTSANEKTSRIRQRIKAILRRGASF